MTCKNAFVDCYKSSGVENNIVALHNWIKTTLFNPLFSLIYLSLHFINILLLATTAERLAKIIVYVNGENFSEPKKSNKSIALYNSFGFLFETLPQFVCQGLVLAVDGSNTTAIVSVSITP